eukprot:1161543-Amphidinium_carterae.1
MKELAETTTPPSLQGGISKPIEQFKNCAVQLLATFWKVFMNSNKLNHSAVLERLPGKFAETAE